MKTKTVNVYTISVSLKSGGKMSYISLSPFADSIDKEKGYEGEDDGGIAYVLPETYELVETPTGDRYIGRPINNDKSMFCKTTLTVMDGKPTLIDYNVKTLYIPLEKAA